MYVGIWIEYVSVMGTKKIKLENKNVIWEEVIMIFTNSASGN